MDELCMMHDQLNVFNHSLGKTNLFLGQNEGRICSLSYTERREWDRFTLDRGMLVIWRLLRGLP